MHSLAEFLPRQGTGTGPRWLTTGGGAAPFLPVGWIDQQRQRGVVCVVDRSGQAAPTLVVLDGDLSVRSYPLRRRPLPAVDLSGRATAGPTRQHQVHLIARLGWLCCHGYPCQIGYVKAGQQVAQVRRLHSLLPVDDGRGVIAQDVDRGAVRRFNLDRVEWCDVVTSALPVDFPAAP